MLPVHTILHPTDFSAASQHAFQLSCALARDYGAHLILLHITTRPTIVYAEAVIVDDPEERRQEARNLLAQLDTGSDVRAERRVEEGTPVEEILRVAAETQCDLIVMGTHGRRGLSRLLMGSVAEQVLRRAPCPVLTVKTPTPIAERAPARSELAQQPVGAGG